MSPNTQQTRFLTNIARPHRCRGIHGVKYCNLEFQNLKFVQSLAHTHVGRYFRHSLVSANSVNGLDQWACSRAIVYTEKATFGSPEDALVAL